MGGCVSVGKITWDKIRINLNRVFEEYDYYIQNIDRQPDIRRTLQKDFSSRQVLIFEEKREKLVSDIKHIANKIESILEQADSHGVSYLEFTGTFYDRDVRKYYKLFKGSPKYILEGTSIVDDILDFDATTLLTRFPTEKRFKKVEGRIHQDIPEESENVSSSSYTHRRIEKNALVEDSSSYKSSIANSSRGSSGGQSRSGEVEADGRGGEVEN